MRTLVLAFLCGCAAHSFGPIAPGYAESDRSVVALVDEEGSIYCSGVLIEQGILTAAHCVDDEPTVRVALSAWVDEEGEYMRASRDARVVRVDAEADLALLALPAGWDGWLRPRTVAPVLGEPVVVCGHPVGLPYVCHSGHVSGRTRHFSPGLHREGWFTVDAGLIPGMSGGPVFDQSGQVLGITSFYAGYPTVGGVIDPGTIQAFLTQ